MTVIEERSQAVVSELSDRRTASAPISSWVRRASCVGRPHLFDDHDRRDEALRLCEGCPVLEECRAWALRNAVYGVAGGMTPQSRAAWRVEHGLREPSVSIEDLLPAEVVGIDCRRRLSRSDAVLAAVARWTEKGESGRQIAGRLGVTRRTVTRLRASCRQRQMIA